MSRFSGFLLDIFEIVQVKKKKKKGEERERSILVFEKVE